MRGKIGLAAENRPFKTTPKGTTQRRLIQHDYEDLIEALYRNDHKKDLECLDEGSLANILTHPSGCSQSTGKQDRP